MDAVVQQIQPLLNLLLQFSLSILVFPINADRETLKSHLPALVFSNFEHVIPFVH